MKEIHSYEPTNSHVYEVGTYSCNTSNNFLLFIFLASHIHFTSKFWGQLTGLCILCKHYHGGTDPALVSAFMINI